MMLLFESISMQNEESESNERSSQASQHREERVYREFEAVLETVHDAFLSLHTSFASEERWRWDMPIITFAWNNGQGLQLNLNGHALGRTHPIGLEIESNAWIDVYEGRDLIRFWRNYFAGRLDAGSIYSYERVLRFVDIAYQTVSAWTREDLENRVVLSQHA